MEPACILGSMKNTSLKILLSLSLIIPHMAFAQELESHDLDIDAETQLTEQIRAEQLQYFQELQNSWMTGEWASPSGSCKYISSIFTPPISKTVTLTFDDGPSAELTPVVLNVLKKYGVKATFFMLGNAAKSKMALVKRIRDEGHIIANHSYSHPNFHALSTGSQTSEFSTTDSILSSMMPQNLKLFRYPYGNSTCGTNALAGKLGYRGIVGWHIDSCDWAFAKNGYVTQKQANLCAVSASNMANYAGHVVSEAKRRNGGIILMHDVHSHTAYSVEEIIVRLKREGFTFTNLDDPRMAKYFR
jgi:peptidoglycan/xylan/chitin deacetylase (PgdA/CDA1 family)